MALPLLSSLPASSVATRPATSTARTPPVFVRILYLSPCIETGTNVDTALIHAIGGILILGYSMEYYFHLRMCFPAIKLLIYRLYGWDITDFIFFLTRSPQEPPPLSFPFQSNRWRIDVYTGSSVLVSGKNCGFSESLRISLCFNIQIYYTLSFCRSCSRFGSITHNIEA